MPKSYTVERLQAASDSCGLLLAEIGNAGLALEPTEIITQRLDVLTKFMLDKLPDPDKGSLALELEVTFAEQMRDMLEQAASQARQSKLLVP